MQLYATLYNKACWKSTAGRGFYPGGSGSGAPALGACCLGFTPSVVAVVLLPLLPPPAPEAFASPKAGDEEDEDNEVAMVVALWAVEVNVEGAAAQSLGLAAGEEAGACVEGGRLWDVPLAAVSESARKASCLQSSWSSLGGRTSPVVADDAARPASQDPPLTADMSEKDNPLAVWTWHSLSGSGEKKTF